MTEIPALNPSPNILIETLVLVAIWDHSPFIFQGFFTITSDLSAKKTIIVFRCESEHEERDNILNQDFAPDAYTFTYFHSSPQGIELNSHLPVMEIVLYLFKYALNVTLQEMLRKPQPPLLADDIAMESITKTVMYLLSRPEKAEEEKEIGFAVSIPFQPSDANGQAAVLFLLGEELTQHF